MNKRNIIIAAVVIVLIVLGIVINSNKSVESVPNVDENNQMPSYQIIVDIKGEVKNPGLYYLSSDSRVIDAINIAGGVTAYADIERVNLATKLTDEMVINIFKKETSSNNNKISINTASVDELTKISGIGEVKAKAIVEYREKYGYYMSLEEIIKSGAVNDKLFDQIKELICL